MEDLEGIYIRWSEYCVWQSFGDVLAIVGTLKPERGLIPTDEKPPGVRLNAVGKDIWELCDGLKTFNQIYEQLLEEYEGDPEKIRKDLETTVTTLHQKGLLTYEDQPKEYNTLTVPLTKYPFWDDNVLWNEVDGQVVIMNNKTGVSFDFEKELGTVWKLCDGTKTVEELFCALKEEGILSEDNPSTVFKLLLKQLLKLEMITMRDNPV